MYGKLRKHTSDILLRSQKGESYASISRSLGCSYQAVQQVVKTKGRRNMLYGTRLNLGSY